MNTLHLNLILLKFFKTYEKPSLLSILSLKLTLSYLKFSKHGAIELFFVEFDIKLTHV